MHRRLFASLALCVLAGCATLVNTTPSLDPTTELDPKLGYVAGSFAVTGRSSVRFAMRIVAREGEEHFFAFGEPSAAGGYETRMIPLEPGVYRVENLVVYGTSGTEVKRRGVDDEALARWFVVRPAHVAYLGRFTGDSTVSVNSRTVTTGWKLRRVEIRADEVTGAMRVAYPQFETAPLECLACSAPKADATSYAEPALTPERAAAQGIAVPVPTVVPAKAKVKPRKAVDEGDERYVPEDRNGLW